MRLFGRIDPEASPYSSDGTYFELSHIRRRMGKKSVNSDPMELLLNVNCWRCDPWGNPLKHFNDPFGEEDEECETCEGDEHFEEWLPLGIVVDLVHAGEVTEKSVQQVGDLIYPGHGPYLMDIPWPALLLSDVKAEWCPLNNIRFFFTYENRDARPSQEHLGGGFTALKRQINLELVAEIIKTVPDNALAQYERGYAYPEHYWTDWTWTDD